MSLARAFTLRHKRTDTPPHSPPADGNPPPTPKLDHAKLRRMGTVVDRKKISGPVELISTTNMLSYNAPDVAQIRMMRQTSSASSLASSSSGNESDSSSPMGTFGDLTDASSVEESPTTPEPNHLSCYFKAAQDDATKVPRRSLSTGNFHQKSLCEINAPAIPQRALSHSKSAHVQLARKRSVQTMNSSYSGSSPSHARSVSGASSIREQPRASIDFFNGTIEPSHPFSNELEKLSEVAEDLGGAVRDAVTSEDAGYMEKNGLSKWTVDDYLMELQPLYQTAFGLNHPTMLSPPTAAWI